MSAQTASVELVVRVSPPAIQPARSLLVVTVSGDGKTVLVRPFKETQRTQTSVYRFSTKAAFGSTSTTAEVYARIGRPLLDWTWEGSNTVIISYGACGTGKTRTLFGSGDDDDVASAGGLCRRFLADLFGRMEASRHENSCTVTLSCFDVFGTIVDLLHPTHSNATVKCVVVRDLVQAEKVLSMARQRSVNWSTCKTTGDTTACANRVHSFVRITLHNTTTRQFCSTHLIDLVGLKSKKDSHNSAQSRERARASQHLLSFARVLAELGAQEDPIASRECKLTQLLRPLLTQQNTRTLLLCLVSPEEDALADTLATLRLPSSILPLEIPHTGSPSLPDDEGEDVQLVPFDDDNNNNNNNNNGALPADSALLLNEIHTIINRILRKPSSGDESLPSSSPSSSAGDPDVNELHLDRSDARRNVEALSAAFCQQQDIIERQAERISELECRLAEKTTTQEVMVEDLKCECLTLRGKLRRLEQGTQLHDLFALYEKDIQKLEDKLADTQASHATMMGKLHEVALYCRVPGSEFDMARPAKSALKTVQDEIQNVCKELEIMRKENREMKMKERAHQLETRRLSEALQSTRRVRRLKEPATCATTAAATTTTTTMQSVMTERANALQNEVDELRHLLSQVIQERKENTIKAWRS